LSGVGENDMQMPDGGFLEETEPPVPSQVTLIDARLRQVLDDLAGSDTEVRSPVQAKGQLGRGSEARTIDVNGNAIAIPSDAVASTRALDTRPGLLIEAGDPKPEGTWIWVAGEASRHINTLLRHLDAGR
jgi:hypothetical protein